MWTHSLCFECWLKVMVPPREPVRIKDRPLEKCCNCGHMHQSGIYYRSDPLDMPCQGKGHNVIWTTLWSEAEEVDDADEEE